jgi:hypothetical protein
MTTLARYNVTQWLKKNFPLDDIKGSKQSNFLLNSFTEFTNRTHQQYIDSWKAGNLGDTSCKDFSRKYCQENGIAGDVGNVDKPTVKKYLKDHNLSYAWVDSRPDNVPGAGDICYWREINHVGISYGADIGPPTDMDWQNLDVLVWYTVEGGQDKQITKTITGEDGVKRTVIDENQSFAWVKWKKYPDQQPMLGGLKTNPYRSDLLAGWVCIDRYFYGSDPKKWPDLPESVLQGGIFPGDPSLWLNQDGPDGAGGPGYFSSAGTLFADPFKHDPPHPLAPATRYLDPLKVGKGGK